MPPRGAIGFAAGFAAALGLAAALGACASAPEETGTEAPTDQTRAEAGAASAASGLAAGPAAPGVEDAAPPGLVPPGQVPSGQVIETGAAPGGLAILAPEPPEPPEPSIDDDPQQLYGLGSQALGELLGEPSLIRSEAPARIWQYRSRTCVFDVFLYDPAGGQAGEARVSYIEARDDAAERIDARACLNEILRARMGLPLG